VPLIVTRAFSGTARTRPIQFFDKGRTKSLNQGVLGNGEAAFVRLKNKEDQDSDRELKKGLKIFGEKDELKLSPSQSNLRESDAEPYLNKLVAQLKAGSRSGFNKWSKRAQTDLNLAQYESLKLQLKACARAGTPNIAESIVEKNHLSPLSPLGILVAETYIKAAMINVRHHACEQRGDGRLHMLNNGTKDIKHGGRHNFRDNNPNSTKLYCTAASTWLTNIANAFLSTLSQRSPPISEIDDFSESNGMSEWQDIESFNSKILPQVDCIRLTSAFRKLLHVSSNAIHPDIAATCLTNLLRIGLDIPNQRDFQAVLTAFGKSGNAKEAECWLNRMFTEMATSSEAKAKKSFKKSYILETSDPSHDSDRSSNSTARPQSSNNRNDNETYHESLTRCVNAVVEAWAKSPSGRQNAENWLKRLKSRCIRIDDPNSNGQITVVHPNAWTYSVVVQACVADGDVSAAEGYLLEMRKKKKAPFEKPHEYASARRTAVNAVIDGWGEEKQPRRAEKWLKTLEKEDGSTIVSYNAVIKAWNFAQNTVRAEHWVKRMIENGRKFPSNNKTEVRKMGNASPLPNFSTYSTLIDGFAREGKFERALHWLREAISAGMEDSNCFAAAIRACARARKLGVAENLFREMKERDITPSLRTYVALISAVARTPSSIVSPSQLRSSTSTMDGVSSSVDEGLGGKVEGYLVEAIENSISNINTKRNYMSTNDSSENSDVFDEELVGVYNAVINAFSQKGCMFDPERAEYWLRVMERGEGGAPPPSITSYNTVIIAWARKRDYQRAEKIFEEVLAIGRKNKPKTKNVKPDVYTYNATIEALLASNKSKKAVLRFQDIELAGLEPDKCSYSLVLKAFGSMKDVRQAELYFKRMLTNGLLPDDHVYYTIVNCWVKSQQTKKLKIWIPHLLSKTANLVPTGAKVSKGGLPRDRGCLPNLSRGKQTLDLIANFLTKKGLTSDLQKFDVGVQTASEGYLRLDPESKREFIARV